MNEFACVKVNKRLWIKNVTEDRLVYTPPDFIRLVDRSLMIELARRSTVRGELHIDDLIVFEAKAPRGAGYRKRSSIPEWREIEES